MARAATGLKAKRLRRRCASLDPGGHTCRSGQYAEMKSHFRYVLALGNSDRPGYIVRQLDGMWPLNRSAQDRVPKALRQASYSSSVMLSRTGLAHVPWSRQQLL